MNKILSDITFTINDNQAFFIDSWLLLIIIGIWYIYKVVKK